MAKKRRSTSGPYLLHVELLRDRIPDHNRFPYSLPAVRGLTTLPFPEGILIGLAEQLGQQVSRANPR